MAYQVELIDIIKDFKGFRAVDRINLQIEKGEIVSLLGSSGCGKTTTLRMIAGLLCPTQGQVMIAGKDVTPLPPYKRDISMVFQNYALFPHMTVLDNVMYGLKNRKLYDKEMMRKKANEVLAIVQLTGQEHKFPRQLSGGQQQRVSLARALAVHPQVLLFDEPLSNLDAKLRVQTRTEIRNLLKQMNITALYVTHDQEEALTISDRIAVMHQGHIEQISTPADLYHHPKTAFVADFIGQANLFSGHVVQEGEGTWFQTLNGLRIKIEAFAGNDQANQSLVIRPEDLVITPTRTQMDNSFPGEVVEKNFLGHIIRYLIRMPSGNCVTAQIHPNDDVEAGRQVYINFSKDKATLVNA